MHADKTLTDKKIKTFKFNAHSYKGLASNVYTLQHLHRGVDSIHTLDVHIKNYKLVSKEESTSRTSKGVKVKWEQVKPHSSNTKGNIKNKGESKKEALSAGHEHHSLQ